MPISKWKAEAFKRRPGVLKGDHDIRFNTEDWTPLLKHAPSIKHLFINDAGHGSHHQHPELEAGFIHVFLSSMA